MAKVSFHGTLDDVTVDVESGTSLLEAAEVCGARVGHSCGGVCACSTCHVWVRKGLDSLSAQEDEELDRLDLAFDVKPSSRLACQALVGTADLDVWITQESLTAYLDENPNERRALEAAGKWPSTKPQSP